MTTENFYELFEAATELFSFAPCHSLFTESTLVGNNIMHIYQPVCVGVPDVSLADVYIYRPCVMWCDWAPKDFAAKNPILFVKKVQISSKILLQIPNLASFFAIRK